MAPMSPHHARAVPIAPPAMSVRARGQHSYPLFASRPAAGFPAPADDEVERTLDVHQLIVRNSSATFFVRVEGDSMEGAGIFSGDVLAVDRSAAVRDGVIVVAAVYGELVVKRVRIRAHETALISEQDGYEPIVLADTDDCFIWGVVTGSVRVF